MKRFAIAVISLIAIFTFGGDALAQTGTLMSLPNYSSNYSSSLTRGYWFTAPTDFRMVGLRVPNDTGNLVQNIQVMRFTGNPSGTNHSTLGYFRNVSGNTITSVNYSISQGDIIGILGARGTSTMNNAYAPGGYSTQILGQGTTLYRLYYQSNLNSTQAGSCIDGGTGSIARVEMWYTAPGPEITVTGVAGTRATVYSNANGGGNGVQLGAFTMANGATGGAADITEIEVTASGSGNDATAYSEVAIYRDANSNMQYDAGTDVLVGSVTSFNADDGTATISVASGEQAFTASQSKDYFIVGQFNGTASPGDTFDFEITDLTATQTVSLAYPTGGSVTILGAEISPPDIYLNDTSPAIQDVFLGSTDNVLQRFTINYPAGPGNTVTKIDVEAFGSGDDVTDIDQIKLYRDADADSMLNPANDVQVATSSFTVDDGTLSFTLSGAESMFTQGITRTYFITADFNFNASDSETFQTRVVSIDGLSNGTNINGAPAPASGFSNGVNMLANGLQATVVAGNQSFTIDNAGPGDTMAGEGQFMLAFTLRTLNAAWTVNTVTLRASGTANDQLAYKRLTLFEDTNSNGRFDDSTTDLPAGAAGTSFDANDGIWTVNLNNTTFAAQSSRLFFVVAQLDGAAQPGSTLSFNVDTASGTPPAGGTLIGFPTTEGNVYTIGQPRLLVDHNNHPAQTVNNDSRGPTGAGELIYDVTVTAANATWTVNSLTFTASGSGDDSLDYQLLTLFIESTGNDTFDGAGQEGVAVASTVTAFSADNGSYVADLTNTNFAPGTVRRFYLMAQLSGSADGGDRFQCELTAIDAQSSASGSTIDSVPAGSAAGLIIDTPVVTVMAAIGNPVTTGKETGSAFEHLLAKWRFAGANGDITISGFTLTTEGSGGWGSDLDPNKGLQIFRDDGNGTYDGASTEEALYSGPASVGRMQVNFIAPVVLSSNASMDIFIVLNVRADAGSSTAKDFSCRIAREQDIDLNTGARAVISTPLPESATLNIIEFAVTSFVPTRTADSSGGEPIVITGSGFTAPVSVTIGGVPADGMAVISTDGTMITGIQVPDGEGSNLEIVVSTGLLGARTMPFRFSYGDGLNGPGSASGRCSLDSSGDSYAWLVLALAGLMALLAMRKRCES